jgi:hypothetical protein
MMGGTATIEDLGRLFGIVGRANVDLDGHNIQIFDGITYLMPAQQALDSLRLNVRLPSKVLVACPGLPRDSFYYYSIDGRFEGEYNRLYLVVDNADQVVSVELVNEVPRNGGAHFGTDQGWHTYDFVNTRTKAITTLRIDHKIELGANGRFLALSHNGAYTPTMTQSNTNWDMVRLDSTLVDVERRGSSTLPTTKQLTRWYVPRPIVELILTCVQKSGK